MTSRFSHPNWPEPMPSETIGRQVNISSLPADLRRKLWDRLRERRPELAELYQSEAFVRLKAQFDGAVMLPIEEYRKLMED